MCATRREWSRRQATILLVFAFDDREVNNDFEKKCGILFRKDLGICDAARGYLFIPPVDARARRIRFLTSRLGRAARRCPAVNSSYQAEYKSCRAKRSNAENGCSIFLRSMFLPL